MVVVATKNRLQRKQTMQREYTWDQARCTYGIWTGVRLICSEHRTLSAGAPGLCAVWNAQGCTYRWSGGARWSSGSHRALGGKTHNIKSTANWRILYQDTSQILSKKKKEKHLSTVIFLCVIVRSSSPERWCREGWMFFFPFWFLSEL